jgi:uncharacterized protein YjbI with pentapeptide repeats
MAEEQADTSIGEQAKGSQGEPPQGKPWMLKEISGKPIWDWLELLIVPLIIALGTAFVTFVFTAQQEKRQEVFNAKQQEIENQRSQLLALEEYLNQMGTLLLDRGLRTSDVDADVRDLARARTLLILDMLSPDREPRVLEFLDDMQLIQPDPPDHNEPIISLKFADLRKVSLVKRHLLNSADLEHADLHKANLRGADLSNANLRKADLGKAKMSKADLTEADLTEADLRGAKGISCQQTEQTESLVGTTMPNGRKYKDWRKDKDCGKD